MPKFGVELGSGSAAELVAVHTSNLGVLASLPAKARALIEQLDAVDDTAMHTELMKQELSRVHETFDRVLLLLERVPPKRLGVRLGGRSVELPDGRRKHVGRRAMQRIIMELADQRIARPGTYTPPAHLIELCWPNQDLTQELARNRLHVAVAALRRLGLRKILQSCRRGYRIDPRCAVYFGTGTTSMELT